MSLFLCYENIDVFIISGRSDEQREAKNLINYFEQFSTKNLIIVQIEILETINTILKMLQGSHEDMEKATEVLSSLLSQF